MDGIVETPRTNALMAIAGRMSVMCKPVRVQVLSGWVMVSPLKSYSLSPRTLQLKAMAKTLQRNAVDARAAADSDIYRRFLEDLQDCFETPESKDAREVVVLMLAMCEWPKEEPLQLRGMVGDLQKIVSDWVMSRTIRFWTFQPWLAAMLSSKSEALANTYVSELFKTGLLQPWEREFAERVGTLALQTEVAEVLKVALAKLEPHLQQIYFSTPESKDAREVVVLMLAMCEWPKEEPLQLRGMVGDLQKIVSDWVMSRTIRFWTFQPWLAAMLSSKSEALANTYVSELFKTGLLQPWEREFAERVGTLALQTEVAEVLKVALAKLEPHLQQIYFSVDSTP
ncbi:hypothetical protein P3T76_006717 [Phytophthora citrophthora]|uniref:Uncharacterized protein n=1 Tax=Phytophthora citrophthora TaxID=4793 RepID=A0AAD9GNX0_9STRA|nr:hypothetical protein P3T76_006717 [Phytophthora citrophthora]